MGFEDRFRPEVAEASTTPKPLVACRLLTHERTEIFDPGVVLIPIEEIYPPLEPLQGYIEGLTGAPLTVVDEEHIALNGDRVLDCGDILDGKRVVDLVQTALVEEVVV